MLGAPMYKRFAFEGPVHESLDCVPLTVRRKLDLAGFKIALVGWQALSREERLTLCHLPVDGDGDLAVYREVMAGFCAQRNVPLKPLADPDVAARTWNEPRVPAPLRARVDALGVPLTDERWRALDEESRYALLKLTDPKRDEAKLPAALGELGLLDPARAAAAAERAARCEATSEPDRAS
jgi:hypothetical protein